MKELTFLAVGMAIGAVITHARMKPKLDAALERLAGLEKAFTTSAKKEA